MYTLLKIIHAYRQRRTLEAMGVALLRLQQDRDVADEAMAQYIELTGDKGDI